MLLSFSAGSNKATRNTYVVLFTYRTGTPLSFHVTGSIVCVVGTERERLNGKVLRVWRERIEYKSRVIVLCEFV